MGIIPSRDHLQWWGCGGFGGMRGLGGVVDMGGCGCGVGVGCVIGVWGGVRNLGQCGECGQVWWGGSFGGIGCLTGNLATICLNLFFFSEGL
jgi:hypothetical protein